MIGSADREVGVKFGNRSTRLETSFIQLLEDTYKRRFSV